MRIKDNTIKSHLDQHGKINLHKGTYLIIRENLKEEGYKDTFAMLFKQSYNQFLQIKTITAYRVYFTLFILLIEQESHVIKVTQKQLGEYIGCAGAEISKAITELEKVELILKHSRGEIILNLKYLWRGNLATWQEKVKEIYENI